MDTFLLSFRNLPKVNIWILMRNALTKHGKLHMLKDVPKLVVHVLKHQWNGKYQRNQHLLVMSDNGKKWNRVRFRCSHVHSAESHQKMSTFHAENHGFIVKTMNAQECLKQNIWG